MKNVFRHRSAPDPLRRLLHNLPSPRREDRAGSADKFGNDDKRRYVNSSADALVTGTLRIRRYAAARRGLERSFIPDAPLHLLQK